MRLNIQKWLMGVGVLLLVLFMWIGWVLMQPLQAEFLSKSSPQYVVVLGGGGGLRVAYAVQQLESIPANVPVFVTGGGQFYGKSDALHMKTYAQSLDVKQPIIPLATSLSTWEDATHLLAYFNAQQVVPTSLLVVTSDFHSGRARWVFEHVFPDTIIYSMSVPHYLNGKRWWQDYNVMQHVLEEKARWLFYRLVLLFRPSIIEP